VLTSVAIAQEYADRYQRSVVEEEEEVQELLH
jgi:hypothetical protein